MSASVLGYEPDPIFAIGTDDVEGDLRLEDMIASIQTLEEAAVYMKAYYENTVLPLFPAASDREIGAPAARKAALPAFTFHRKNADSAPVFPETLPV